MLIGDKTKHKRIFFYFILLVLLILINFIVSSKLVNSEFPFTSNISIFLLINLNIVLLLALLIVIFRNLAKIFFTKSKGVFGTSLQSKLVIFSIILSVIPVSIVFVFSISIINNSINKWFDAQVEQALKSSVDLMQRYQNQLEQDLVEQTSILSKLLTTKGFLYQRNYGELKNFIVEYLQNNRIDGVAVYNKEGNRILSEDKKYYINFLVDKETVVEIVENAKQVAKYEFFGDNQIYWVGAPVSAKTSKKLILGALFVYKIVPPAQAQKVSKIMDSYRNYSQIKFFAEPVKNSYKILLILMTLLVALAGIWGSIVFSKNITEPLGALAEASKKISKGDLDVKLEEEGDYELLVLIKSFNEMASRLKEHTEQLNKKNIELDKMYRQIFRDNQYIDTIFKNTKSAIFLFDENLRILKLNDKAKEILEIGEEWWDEILELLKEFFNKHNEKIKSFQKDLEIHSIKKTFSITLSKVYLSHDEPDNIILFMDDITDILNVKKYEIWKEIANRIAHEIKNPLTPIKLNAERILKKLKEENCHVSQTIQKSIKTIIFEVNDLYKMVNEFNEFARMPNIYKSYFNLSDVLNEVVEFYKISHNKINFIFNIKEKIYFYGDVSQIKRLFHNLLNNAIAAVNDNGMIEINMSDNKEYIVLSFKDNGVGIKKEDVDKIFLPYFSKKSGGTGLGLSIVKKIVEEHDGEIFVESVENEYTIFNIKFKKSDWGK
ncbi:ATP-binding protein [Deferribacter abyssi]|uniref:ATP-binding protein n=1 Tax=Deferribacter abyssi TaxID=213806 RepID=UPI003C214AA9